MFQTLADCLEIQFTLYRIVPVGSHSFVQCLDTGAELPLFGSGGFKPFGQKKFDEGICAFMECFCQLQKHIERAQVKMLHFMLIRFQHYLTFLFCKNSLLAATFYQTTILNMTQLILAISAYR